MRYAFSVLNVVKVQDLLLMDSLGFIKEHWDSEHKYVDIYAYNNSFYCDTASSPFVYVIKPNQVEEVVLLMQLGIPQEDIVTTLEI